MRDSPIPVEVEWLDYRHGFAVKVGGKPVYASKSSLRAEGVAEFIRGMPELAQAFAHEQAPA